MDDFGPFDMRLARVVEPKFFKSSMHLTLGASTPIPYGNALITPEQQLCRNLIMQSSPLPVGRSLTCNNDFVFGDYTFHVHSRASKFVKLSLVNLIFPTVSFPELTTSPTLHETCDDVNYLATLLLRFRRGYIHVARSGTAIVSRRPSHYPLSSVDRAVAFTCNLDLKDSPLFYESRLPVLSPLPVSLPGIASRFPLPIIAPGYLGKSFPSVPGLSNLCPKCGQVTICRHIFKELLSHLDLLKSGISTTVQIVFHGLREHRHYTAPIPVFSFSNPYTRHAYALAFQGCLSIDTDQRILDIVEQWVTVEHAVCESVYNACYEAQGMDDIATRLKNISSVVFGYVRTAPSSCFSFFIECCTQFFSFLTKQIVAGVTYMIFVHLREFVSNLFSNITNAASMVVQTIGRYKAILMLFFKIIVRYVLGYSLTAHLFELSVDPITEIAMQLTYCKLQAQGPDAYGSLLGVIFSGICTLLSLNPTTSVVSRLISSALMNMSLWNRSGFWDKLQALYSYATDSPDVALLESYNDGVTKDSVTFYNLYVSTLSPEYKKNNKIDRALGHYYYLHLKALPLMNASERRYIESICKPACAYVLQAGIQQLQDYRRVPDVFCFFGEAGLGKSDLLRHFAQQAVYYEHHSLDIQDYAYTVSATDSFSSGYNRQSMWIMDELYPSKDGTTAAAQAPCIPLILQLCTPSPQALNMASLADKGMLLNCSIVLTSCNLQMAGVDPLIHQTKSMTYPAAFSERVSYRIRPVLLPGFSINNRRIVGPNGLQIKQTHPRDLYTFEVYDSKGARRSRSSMGFPPNANDMSDLTYSELMTLIVSSYSSGENFVAPKFTGSLDDEIIAAIRERTHADQERYNPSKPPPDQYVQAIPSSPIPIILPFGDFDSPITDPSFPSSSSSSSSSREEMYEAEGLFSYFYPSDGNNVPKYFSIDPLTSLREPITDVLYEFSPEDLDVLRDTPEPYSVSCPECAAYTMRGDRICKVYVRRLSHIGYSQIAFAAFSMLAVVFGTTWYFRSSGPEDDDPVKDFDDSSDGELSSPQGLPKPHRFATTPNSLWNKPLRDKYYSSQGDPSPWSEVGNARGNAAFYSVLDSLFTLTSHGGIFVCNVFALDQATIVGPNHILRYLTDFALRGDFGGEAVHYTYSSETYTRLEPIDPLDIGVIRLHKPIFGVKNLCNLLQHNSNCSGEVVRVFRNASGIPQIMRMHADVPDSYANYSHRGVDMRLSPSEHRTCLAQNEAGMCGSIYIALRSQERETVVGGPIFGMHVAGRPSTNVSVFTLLSRAMFTNTVPDACYKGADGGGQGLVSLSGINTSNTLARLPTISKASLGKVPMPDDGLSAPSLLFPAVSAGKELLPTNHYISLLNAPLPPDLPDLYPSGVKLIEKILSYGEPVPDEATTIAAIVGGFSEVNSIDRSAASGYPLTLEGTKKGDHCLLDEESKRLEFPHIITPSPALIETVHNLEQALHEGRIFDSVASIALKEEPVTIAKVLIGKTRVYSVVPLHENILAKRWFLRGLMTVARGHTAGSGMFDLGATGKQVHDDFLTKLTSQATSKFGRNRFTIAVLAQDYRNFDLSFNPDFKRYVGFVARSVERGSPLPRSEIDYPVKARDRLRFKVWARTSEFRAHFSSEEYPGVGHPSGSNLTSYINYIGQELALTDSFETTNPEALWIELLMGDDSLVFIAYSTISGFDLAAFIAHEESLGFHPVNDAKTGPPVLLAPYRGETDFSEYSFCSHVFTKNNCVLSINRLNRILPFQKRGREEIGLTGCLSAVQNYLRPYHADNLHKYLDLIHSQIAYCGFENPEKFLALSPQELTREFSAYFFSNPQKFFAVVPPYNQPKISPNVNLDEYFAQGIDEDPNGVSFVDDAGVEIVSAPSQPHFIEAHLPSHELAEPYRFERPFNIDTFQTGLSFNTRTYPTLSTYFKANFFAQLAIYNRAYLHCDVLYRFIVSGSPLTTGQIICSSHYTNYTPNLVYDYEAAGSEHVILDLPSCRQAELKIPMILPNNVALINAVSSFNQYVQYFDFGNVRVHNLTPISEDVTVTIFCWLENVKLRGACLSTWTLPVPNLPVTTYNFSVSHYEPQGKDSIPNAATVKAASKAKMDEKRMDWQMEHTPGWVATTEASVASVGHMIEGISSSILGPIGDFAGEAGDAAPALLGFSAPPIDTHLTPITPLTSACTANVIGEVPTTVLGASQCTHIVRPPGLFGTNEDEMHVYNMVKQWQLLYVTSWSPSTPAGIRWQYPIMPGLYFTTTPTVYPHIAHPTRLAYLTTLFQYWRGGLKFKIVLSKTALHTGLLELEYQAGHGTVRSVGAQSGALPRVLWDISRSNSIEITIPYNSWSAWTPCMTWPFFGPDVPAGLSYSTGRLQVNIINPITDSSGTVSGPVPMIWWISACPDFEFTSPIIHNTITYSTDFVNLSNPATNSKSEGKKKRRDGEEFEAQGKDDLFPTPSLSLNTKIISSSPNDCYSHLTTVGERWLSTRLLLRRAPTTVLPFFVTSQQPIGRSISFGELTPTNQMFRALACLYNFYSGGFRVRFRMSAPSTSPLVLRKAHLYSTTWGHNNFSPARLIYYDDQNPSFIDIPYTSQFSFQPLRRDTNFYIPRTTLFLEANPDYIVNLSFSTMDDFTFGGLTGAPAFTIASSPPPFPS